ncbi:putative 50 kda protein in type i retrotransposable element r1dm, partial [Lasius niger]
MRHSEAAYRVLLSSREKLDKREEIEATFRVCRDAFLEVTRETLFKVLKPSDCGLRINRVSLTGNKGVRIEAFSPDIERIKAHSGLVNAGLKVEEYLKVNPRLIVHGIPAEMTADEIGKELVAQNLGSDAGGDLKVVYVYPAKTNRRYTSCILEVTPALRGALLKNGRVFLRY